MPIESAEDLIRLHEGTGPQLSGRFRVYDDATGKPIVSGSTVVGHPSIGVGRNLAGLGLSAEETEYLLKNDLARVRAHADKFPWFWDLNEPRQAVVIDLIFNMGIVRFLKFAKMIKALVREDYETAAVELLDSRYAEQVGARATRNAGILVTGEWP